MVGAEEEGLASIAIGCLDTRIMPEPGGSGWGAGSTASSACFSLFNYLAGLFHLFVRCGCRFLRGW